MSPPIRIIVVEDNKPYAESLREMSEMSDMLEWLGVYQSAEDCLAAFEEERMKSADVLLLDLQLPGKSGMSLIPHLRRTFPKLRILILTRNEDHLTALEAIQLGVGGYVLKDATIRAIRRAIIEVHHDGCVIDPQLSRLVLRAADAGVPAGENPLSKREREVLELLSTGLVKKEVADSLGIGYSAVALYTANIFRKLEVENVAAAIATAIRKRLI